MLKLKALVLKLTMEHKLTTELLKVYKSAHSASSLLEEHNRTAEEYLESIQNTLKFLPFNFSQLNIQLPNQEAVVEALQCKTAFRLEKLVAKFREFICAMEKQLSLVQRKLEEFAKKSSKKPEHTLAYEKLQKLHHRSQEALGKHYKSLEELRYFSYV